MPGIDEELSRLRVLHVDLEALAPAKALLGRADARPSAVRLVDLEHHVERLRVRLIGHFQRAAFHDLNDQQV